MTYSIENLAKLDRRDTAGAVAYDVEALITTARLALDPMATDLPRESIADAVERTLGVASMLMAVVSEGTEFLQRDLQRGTWAKEDKVTAIRE